MQATPLPRAFFAGSIGFALSVVIAFTFQSCGDGAGSVDGGCTSLGFSGDITNQGMGLKAISFSGNYRLAQSFQLNAATTISAVKLKLAKAGNPANATLTVHLVADSGGLPLEPSVGSPTGTFLIDSTSSNVSTTTTQYTFALTPALTTIADPPTTYWIIFSTNYAVNQAADFIYWAGSDGNIFTSGKAIYEVPSTVWNQTISKDFNFELVCPAPSPSVSPSP